MALSVSNGYVVYHRGADSNSPYWRSVHKKAAADASTIRPIQTGPTTNKLQEAGARLLAIGESERAKEIALIEAATGTRIDGSDIMTFVRNFNEVLMGKE